MQLFDDAFPILVGISPMTWDDAYVRDMIAAYDVWLERGERYAVLTHTPPGAGLPSAKQRKAVTDWTNASHNRARMAKLCVGSSTVLPNALTRGAYTAMLWLWTPPNPTRACATPLEAFDWCWEQLRQAGVPTQHDRDETQRRVLAHCVG